MEYYIGYYICMHLEIWNTLGCSTQIVAHTSEHQSQLASAQNYTGHFRVVVSMVLSVTALLFI